MSFFGKSKDFLIDTEIDEREKRRHFHFTRKLAGWLWAGLCWWATTFGKTVVHPRKHWISSIAHGFIVVSVVMSLLFGFVPTSPREITKIPGAPFGATLARAIADDIYAELGHHGLQVPLFGWWLVSGWGENDPFPYPYMLYPYRNAYQHGKKRVWELVSRRFLTTLAQSERDVTFDPHLEKASEYINAPRTVWGVPSVEEYLTLGAKELRAYADNLPKHHNFYPRPDSLILLISDLQYALNGSITSLRPEIIGFMMGWEPFQEAQGVIEAIIEILEAVKVEFPEVWSAKPQSKETLDVAITDLKSALGMSPWVVCNGESKPWLLYGPCFGYTDIAILNQRISGAERSLSSFAKAVRSAN